jgi:hypothetical protein
MLGHVCLLAAVLGSVLALSVSAAVAGHEHSANGWNHGMGDGDLNSGWFHPYMATTDNSQKWSCTNYIRYDFHTTNYCVTSSHNHQNIYPQEAECAYGTHPYGDGLSHHAHVWHTGTCV